MDRLDEADPMVQTAFLNTYSHALSLTAHYDEGLETGNQELELARLFSMDFVVPHALLAKAAAAMGLRQFRESRDYLRAAQRWARKADDVYVPVVTSMFGARIDLYEGRPDEALARLEASWARDPSPSLQGELLSVRGLALAVLGRADESLQTCGEALASPKTIETRVLAESTKAIAALKEKQPEAEDFARNVFSTSLQIGSVDGFQGREKEAVVISLVRSNPRGDDLRRRSPLFAFDRAVPQGRPEHRAGVRHHG